MIWYWSLLLREELLSIWISFLENIDKNCLKTKENTLSVQESLDIQPEKQLLSQTKGSVMNQIPHRLLKSFELMITTKNIFKITRKQ